MKRGRKIEREGVSVSIEQLSRSWADKECPFRSYGQYTLFNQKSSFY